MYIVRILSFTDAAGPKPYLSFGFIDFLDTAHDPRSFSDLVFYTTGLCIIKIEVVPAVTFRHPYDFLLAVQVMTESLTCIIYECFALFIHDSGCFAGISVYAYNPQLLVTTLIVEESKPF